MTRCAVPDCRAPLRPSQRRYCSTTCAGAAKRRPLVEREVRRCACGCGETFLVRPKVVKQFASRAHFFAALKLPAFRPLVVRRWRTAVAVRRRRAEARAEAAYPSKAAAWSAGYRTGYNAAMRWWKRRTRQLAAHPAPLALPARRSA